MAPGGAFEDRYRQRGAPIPLPAKAFGSIAPAERSKLHVEEET
ncbi:MAG: hypothetical protein JWR11_4497 [Mycobacterium sp.]|jgi:hypothetical protein|nr:hypothetical protein [Mycobacterium sp.]MDT5070045.1 hypothetical protein [Mycobacterium sp.]MDT5179242.1 hypothetical protein [Mycobacterium sp.]